MSDYDNIDEGILEAIDRIRHEHGACTARLVGRAIRVSPDIVRYRLQKMRDEKLVTWSEVPGSLRRVEKPKPRKKASRKKSAAKKSKKETAARRS